MFRFVILAFSILCYGAFLATFVYLLAFLGNFQASGLTASLPGLRAWIPYSIDLGRDMGSLTHAATIDVGLIALFGIQHSVMARPGFKRAWKRLVPQEAERSVYVLTASAVLALVMWQWRPIPTVALWQADTGLTAAIGWGVMGLGVVVLIWATFLIDHFELLGLKQGWSAFRNKPFTHPRFVTPYLYKLVRHPQYLGWLLIFWGTPTMTFGHLLFAAGMSTYIVIAVQFEERDLSYYIGADYRHYREQVPALVPLPGQRYSG